MRYHPPDSHINITGSSQDNESKLNARREYIKTVLSHIVVASVMLFGIFVLPYCAIDYIRHGLERPMTWASLAAFIFAGALFLLALMLMHLLIRSLRSVSRLYCQHSASSHRDNRQTTSDPPQGASKISISVSQNDTNESEDKK
jgi:ABC-type multidrug transport system fused ATPase/permease subunit